MVKQGINHELFLMHGELSNPDVERDDNDFDKYQDIDLDFKLLENDIKFEDDDYFQGNRSLNL